MKEKFDSLLKTYMYKIAGIHQMIITHKNSGDVLGSFSKFQRQENIENISAISNTLYQLSSASEKNLDMNTFEFDSGEKLFTVNGGDNLILSALADKSVQMGISRMYLKIFAQRLDTYFKMNHDTVESQKDQELSEIFKHLSGNV